MDIDSELRFRRRSIALAQDIAAIRKILAEPKPPLGFARTISASLRRILFDDHDLRDVASKLSGAIRISCPDAKPYRWLETEPKLILFVLGQVDIYNFSIRNISVFSGNEDMLAARGMRSEEFNLTDIPIESFCKQFCLQFEGTRFDRRTVNKFVADTGSGIHSLSPSKRPLYEKLDQIKHFISMDFEKEIPEILCHHEVLYNKRVIIERNLDFNIDLALFCVISTAKCLVDSMDVMRLEAAIAAAFQ